MNILPLAITAAGAVPSIIGGIMNAVLAGKKLSGGRLRRRKHVVKKRKGKGLARMRRRGGAVRRRPKRKHVRRQKGGRLHRRKRARGRGVIADTLGSVPLLGALLGPLAKAFGGKLKRMPTKNRRALMFALARRLRGKGLSPMYIRRPYVSSGCGLSPMYIRRPYVSSGCGLRRAGSRRPGYHLARRHGGRLAPIGGEYKIANKSYLTPTLARQALASMFPASSPPLPMTRAIPPLLAPPASPPLPIYTHKSPALNMDLIHNGTPLSFPGGLLRPAGGATYRKGHLRKVKGKGHKIRVKPTMVGRGLLAPAGGYIPYHGRYGVYGQL